MVGNDPVNYVDFLGYWKIYDVMGGQTNLRFELSISALTRKFNLPRIPIVHDTLKSYGIVLESKQLEKNGQDCVEVSIGGFGNAGALKNALKSGLRRVPGVRKVADKIDADVVLIGSIKVIDCECFKREDVNLGGEIKIQAQAGYGGFFGRKPGRTKDYRSGSGGAVDRFGLGGIRGPFVGAFAEFGFSPSLSNEGLDLEIGGGATGFVGYRGAIIDVRAGGELSGKVVFGIIPELKYKEGGFNASFF
jgi:hypothetical protein